MSCEDLLDDDYGDLFNDEIQQNQQQLQQQQPQINENLQQESQQIYELQSQQLNNDQKCETEQNQKNLEKNIKNDGNGMEIENNNIHYTPSKQQLLNQQQLDSSQKKGGFFFNDSGHKNTFKNIEEQEKDNAINQKMNEKMSYQQFQSYYSEIVGAGCSQSVRENFNIKKQQCEQFQEKIQEMKKFLEFGFDQTLFTDASLFKQKLITFNIFFDDQQEMIQFFDKILEYKQKFKNLFLEIFGVNFCLNKQFLEDYDYLIQQITGNLKKLENLGGSALINYRNFLEETKSFDSNISNIISAINQMIWLQQARPLLVQNGVRKIEDFMQKLENLPEEKELIQSFIDQIQLEVEGYKQFKDFDLEGLETEVNEIINEKIDKIEEESLNCEFNIYLEQNKKLDSVIQQLQKIQSVYSVEVKGFFGEKKINQKAQQIRSIISQLENQISLNNQIQKKFKNAQKFEELVKSCYQCEKNQKLQERAQQYIKLSEQIEQFKLQKKKLKSLGNQQKKTMVFQQFLAFSKQQQQKMKEKELVDLVFRITEFEDLFIIDEQLKELQESLDQQEQIFKRFNINQEIDFKDLSQQTAFLKEEMENQENQEKQVNQEIDLEKEEKNESQEEFEKALNEVMIQEMGDFVDFKQALMELPFQNSSLDFIWIYKEIYVFLNTQEQEFEDWSKFALGYEKYKEQIKEMGINLGDVFERQYEQFKDFNKEFSIIQKLLENCQKQKSKYKEVEKVQAVYNMSQNLPCTFEVSKQVHQLKSVCGKISEIQEGIKNIKESFEKENIRCDSQKIEKILLKYNQQVLFCEDIQFLNQQLKEFRQLQQEAKEINCEQLKQKYQNCYIQSIGIEQKIENYKQDLTKLEKIFDEVQDCDNYSCIELQQLIEYNLELEKFSKEIKKKDKFQEVFSKIVDFQVSIVMDFVSNSDILSGISRNYLNILVQDFAKIVERKKKSQVTNQQEIKDNKIEEEGSNNDEQKNQESCENLDLEIKEQKLQKLKQFQNDLEEIFEGIDRCQNMEQLNNLVSEKLIDGKQFKCLDISEKIMERKIEIEINFDQSMIEENKKMENENNGFKKREILYAQNCNQKQNLQQQKQSLIEIEMEQEENKKEEKQQQLEIKQNSQQNNENQEQIYLEDNDMQLEENQIQNQNDFQEQNFEQDLNLNDSLEEQQEIQEQSQQQQKKNNNHLNTTNLDNQQQQFQEQDLDLNNSLESISNIQENQRQRIVYKNISFQQQQQQQETNNKNKQGNVSNVIDSLEYEKIQKQKNEIMNLFKVLDRPKGKSGNFVSDDKLELQQKIRMIMEDNIYWKDQAQFYSKKNIQSLEKHVQNSYINNNNKNKKSQQKEVEKFLYFLQSFQNFKFVSQRILGGTDMFLDIAYLERLYTKYQFNQDNLANLERKFKKEAEIKAKQQKLQLQKSEKLDQQIRRERENRELINMNGQNQEVKSQKNIDPLNKLILDKHMLLKYRIHQGIIEPTILNKYKKLSISRAGKFTLTKFDNTGDEDDDTELFDQVPPIQESQMEEYKQYCKNFMQSINLGEFLSSDDNNSQEKVLFDNESKIIQSVQNSKQVYNIFDGFMKLEKNQSLALSQAQKIKVGLFMQANAKTVKKFPKFLGESIESMQEITLTSFYDYIQRIVDFSQEYTVELDPIKMKKELISGGFIEGMNDNAKEVLLGMAQKQELREKVTVIKWNNQCKMYLFSSKVANYQLCQDLKLPVEKLGSDKFPLFFALIFKKKKLNKTEFSQLQFLDPNQIIKHNFEFSQSSNSIIKGLDDKIKQNTFKMPENKKKQTINKGDNVNQDSQITNFTNKKTTLQRLLNPAEEGYESKCKLNLQKENNQADFQIDENKPLIGTETVKKIIGDYKQNTILPISKKKNNENKDRNVFDNFDNNTKNNNFPTNNKKKLKLDPYNAKKTCFKIKLKPGVSKEKRQEELQIQKQMEEKQKQEEQKQKQEKEKQENEQLKNEKNQDLVKILGQNQNINNYSSSNINNNQDNEYNDQNNSLESLQQDFGNNDFDMEQQQDQQQYQMEDDMGQYEDNNIDNNQDDNQIYNDQFQDQGQIQPQNQNSDNKYQDDYYQIDQFMNIEESGQKQRNQNENLDQNDDELMQDEQQIREDQDTPLKQQHQVPIQEKFQKQFQQQQQQINDVVQDQKLEKKSVIKKQETDKKSENIQSQQQQSKNNKNDNNNSGQSILDTLKNLMKLGKKDNDENDDINKNNKKEENFDKKEKDALNQKKMKEASTPVTMSVNQILESLGQNQNQKQQKNQNQNQNNNSFTSEGSQKQFQIQKKNKKKWGGADISEFLEKKEEKQSQNQNKNQQKGFSLSALDLNQMRKNNNLNQNSQKSEAILVESDQEDQDINSQNQNQLLNENMQKLQQLQKGQNYNQNNNKNRQNQMQQLLNSQWDKENSSKGINQLNLGLTNSVNIINNNKGKFDSRKVSSKKFIQQQQSNLKKRNFGEFQNQQSQNLYQNQNQSQVQNEDYEIEQDDDVLLSDQSSPDQNKQQFSKESLDFEQQLQLEKLQNKLKILQEAQKQAKFLKQSQKKGKMSSYNNQNLNQNNSYLENQEDNFDSFSQQKQQQQLMQQFQQFSQFQSGRKTSQKQQQQQSQQQYSVKKDQQFLRQKNSMVQQKFNNNSNKFNFQLNNNNNININNNGKKKLFSEKQQQLFQQQFRNQIQTPSAYSQYQEESEAPEDNEYNYQLQQQQQQELESEDMDQEQFAQFQQFQQFQQMMKKKGFSQQQQMQLQQQQQKSMKKFGKKWSMHKFMNQGNFLQQNFQNQFQGFNGEDEQLENEEDDNDQIYQQQQQFQQYQNQNEDDEYESNYQDFGNQQQMQQFQMQLQQMGKYGQNKFQKNYMQNNDNQFMATVGKNDKGGFSGQKQKFFQKNNTKMLNFQNNLMNNINSNIENFNDEQIEQSESEFDMGYNNQNIIQQQQNNQFKKFNKFSQDNGSNQFQQQNQNFKGRKEFMSGKNTVQSGYFESGKKQRKLNNGTGNKQQSFQQIQSMQNQLNELMKAYK